MAWGLAEFDAEKRGYKDGLDQDSQKAKIETDEISDIEKIQLVIQSALVDGLGIVDIEDKEGKNKVTQEQIFLIKVSGWKKWV